MWTMEDVLSELRERGEESENEKGRNNNGLPPGFRFHPTDEELITYYLASKVFYNHTITTPVHIAEVDLNRVEPWDLPGTAKMGEKEWYLYSLRDRKYPTGLRTNRATGTGYWKATGKDRQVTAGSIGNGTGTAGVGPSSSGGMLIGMKKTLVFYQGRAPRGVKTRWVMHEYRLDGHFSSFRFSSKDEWVICRIFHKHGGDKKTTFHPPPPLLPPSAPQLSPFLRHLPPLLDVPTASSTSSTSSSTIHSLQNSDHKPLNNLHYDSNFLLQSLLSNPLPNFSSLTDNPNTTLFTTTTTTSSASIGHPPPSFHLNPLCGGDCEDNERTVGCDMSSSVGASDRLLYPHHINNFSMEPWPLHH
ncbi:hypothetical protein vseg_017902 [Gypsophila vaccaria]